MERLRIAWNMKHTAQSESADDGFFLKRIFHILTKAIQRLLLRDSQFMS